MNISKMRSVTVLVDASLERTLCEKLRNWGATSHVVTESRIAAPGRENHETKRVRIEVIVCEEVASRIIQGLQDESFSDGSLSFFVTEVLTRPGSGTLNHPQQPKRAPREEKWGDYLITM